MLQLIGEQPVNTLENAGITEANLAQTTLHNISRKVQTKGLNCNSDEGVRYAPDVDGYIILPPNLLSVDASDPNRDVAQRGTKLYDRENHTLVFTDAIELDTVIMLDFDDLPQTVKEYIVIKASRKFHLDVLGSELIHTMSENDEWEAWRDLVASEIDKGDHTIFDTNDCIAAVLNRRHNATRK